MRIEVVYNTFERLEPTRKNLMKTNSAENYKTGGTTRVSVGW